MSRRDGRDREGAQLMRAWQRGTSIVRWNRKGIVTWGIVTWGIVTWSVLGLMAPTMAQAQIAPETPRLVSPHGFGGLGVQWLRTETLPGDDEAVRVTWAFPGLPVGLALGGGR